MTHGNKYPGPYVDANTLKSDGAWASDQAVTDALYIVCKQALAAVQNDAAANPRVPNVTDDTRAQSMGGFSYLTVPYGYAQHPPSSGVASVVAAYDAWTAANPRHGHKDA
jgi:hypothetical protein